MIPGIKQPALHEVVASVDHWGDPDYALVEIRTAGHLAFKRGAGAELVYREDEAKPYIEALERRIEDLEGQWIDQVAKLEAGGDAMAALQADHAALLARYQESKSTALAGELMLLEGFVPRRQKVIVPE